jgi:hypothetical protein
MPDGKEAAEYLWQVPHDGFERLTRLWAAAKSGLF